MQSFNEEVKNENGNMFIEMCTYNELKINNTYFKHNYTFRNTRGHKSAIDHVITNGQVNRPPAYSRYRSINSSKY